MPLSPVLRPGPGAYFPTGVSSDSGQESFQSSISGVVVDAFDVGIGVGRCAGGCKAEMGVFWIAPIVGVGADAWGACIGAEFDAVGATASCG